MKKAFTMLELVMVMVIMGIVASIGSDIIAAMYTNYLRSRTINALESKTEIVLEQIAKRLQYRIKESVIARIKDSPYTATALSSADDTYSILEWIGYSNESFLGSPRPGWSGFIDLNHVDTNGSVSKRTLKTPESDLNTTAKDVMSALSYGTVTLTTGNEAALIFKGRPYYYRDFGWEDSNTSNGDSNATIKVSALTATTFKIEQAYPSSSDEIYEQYYLAHTAYAIAPTEINATTGFFNLTLYYNYQPWLTDSRDAYTEGNNSILAHNISLFRFKQDESIIRLKLCLHDNNETGTGDYIVVCKEKVVY
jgi:prepilin-type N-terminal cleavage/methylation domain-containing protein